MCVCVFTVFCVCVCFCWRNYLLMTYHRSYPSPSSYLPIRQQALLAAVSEKDGCINLLELSPMRNMSTPEDVMTLRREKVRFMNHQKQQAMIFTTWFYVFNLNPISVWKVVTYTHNIMHRWKHKTNKMECTLYFHDSTVCFSISLSLSIVDV